MKELAYTLLPDLPPSLDWVYGVVYIVECITFFGLLLAPFLLIFNVRNFRRK